MATVEAPPIKHTTVNVGPFKNEPMTDFTKPENVQAMKAAIEKVRRELGREYPLIIGGKKGMTPGEHHPIALWGQGLRGSARSNWPRRADS